MEEYIIPKPAQQEPTSFSAPNSTKPVWVDPQMNCDQCKYNDQDVDTFPCAKCHTRN
jgi:hypothetical protein